MKPTIGFNVKVRKQFAFLPPIAWAVIIDSLDIFSNVTNFILSFLGGLGIVFDGLFDVVQTLIAFAIFEDPAFVITNVDFILPPAFDIFPAYTAKVLLVELKIIK